MVGRYTDWRHTHVIGAPPEAGAPYLGEARKLLGEVFDQAAFNNLGTHKLRRELSDGTVIFAEKHGEIPRMTIVPAPRKPAVIPVPGRDDFVVWARTTALPDGIDATHPEQILQPAWRTHFYDSDVAGFHGFPGEKGEYSGTFPAGVRYAGNVDWRHEDGSRFSWYGPSSRYWYDAYRQPRAQYGKHVFCLGSILLDVDDYCVTNDVDLDARYVVGAARRGSALYVMMAELPATVTWPAAPATAAETPDGWASPRYPIDNITVVLRRFTLVDDPGAVGPMKLVVAGGSDHELWRAAIQCGAAPWHFDADGLVATTHVPPPTATMVQRGAFVYLPNTSHLRVRVTIDGDSAAHAVDNLSLPAGLGSSGILAEDGEHVLEIVRTTFDGEPDALVYRIGEHTYHAVSSHAVIGEARYIRRQLVWADLRAGVMLLMVDAITFADSVWNFERGLVLCENGVETTLLIEASIVSNFGSGDALHVTLERLAANDVAPLAVAYLHVFGVITLGGNTSDAGCSLLHHPYYPPFRKADTFGEVRWAFSAGAWTNTLFMVNVARDLASNQQVDVLGHTTLPGFATHKGYSLFSYALNASMGGVRFVLNHATGSTLEDLTGVSGTNTTENGIVGYDARYHPIWLLGKPPTGVVS